MSSRIESLTIQEDVKEDEAEDEEGLPIYPYERLKITSTDPVTDIDVTKREVYCNIFIIIYSSPLSYDLFDPVHWKLHFLNWHEFILVLTCLNLTNADISIICGVQREIWDDKGCFLQVAKMETKQIQNGHPVILSVMHTLPCVSPLQFRFQVERI